MTVFSSRGLYNLALSLFSYIEKCDEPWHEIPTMSYVRPAKPQISLRIRAV